MEKVLSILAKSYLTRKSGDGEDYEWRLEKIAKILDDFTSQHQTFMYNEDDDENDKPKRKKRKPPKKTATDILPAELWWEILLLIPYDDIFKIAMFISKDIKTYILDNNDNFWKKKFEIEFQDYKYPKVLGDPDKITWKVATIKLLKLKTKTTKSYWKEKEFWKDIDTEAIYDFGNELLLKFSILYRPYVSIHDLLYKYVEKNKTLDTNFLIDFIHTLLSFDYVDIILNKVLGTNKKKFEAQKLINAFIDYGFEKNVKTFKEKSHGRYNRLPLRLERKVKETYANYKKEYNQNFLKLLKMGILLDRKEYARKLYDENFMEKAKEIDEEIEYVLTNESFLNDVRSLNGYIMIGLNPLKHTIVSEKSRNSYIFVIKALRRNFALFSSIPSKFKSKIKDKRLIFREIKKKKYDIMKIDKNLYIRLFDKK